MMCLIFFLFKTNEDLKGEWPKKFNKIRRTNSSCLEMGDLEKCSGESVDHLDVYVGSDKTCRV